MERQALKFLNQMAGDKKLITEMRRQHHNLFMTSLYMSSYSPPVNIHRKSHTVFHDSLPPLLGGDCGRSEGRAGLRPRTGVGVRRTFAFKVFQNASYQNYLD